MSWIKLDRKIRDWKYSGDPLSMALWIHLLVNANYEDTDYEGLHIPPGSMVCTLRKLAKNTGLTERQLRTRLDAFVRDGQITRYRIALEKVDNQDIKEANQDAKKTTHPNDNETTQQATHQATHLATIISITKYDTYQIKKKKSDTASGTPSDNETTHPNDVIKRIYNTTTNNCIPNNNLSSFNKPAQEDKNYQKSNFWQRQGSEEVDSLYLNFSEWCSREAPEVMKMKEPMTQGQFLKLREEFGRKALAEIIVEMSNWRPLTKKNTSAYKTALVWLKKRQAEGNTGPVSKFREAAEQAERMAERMDERERRQAEQEKGIDYGALRQIPEV